MCYSDVWPPVLAYTNKNLKLEHIIVEGNRLRYITPITPTNRRQRYQHLRRSTKTAGCSINDRHMRTLLHSQKSNETRCTVVNT